VAGHLTLAPELDTFRQAFEHLADEADAMAGHLTDDQFNWHPPSGGWSVAQCIEHLNVTARMYLPNLDEGIADAIRRGLYGEGPFRYNWFGRMFVRSQEPPVKRKFKAAKVFVPPPSRPRQESMAAFRAYQVQFVDRLRQANGLDLARARVKSPAVTWIRLPLGSGFALMAAHERRHLWQARRIIADPAFPRTT
jgi:DinB superfamily